MKRIAAFGLAASLLAAAPAGAGEGDGLKDLPVNKWSRLPCKAEPGYIWSAPVYVPTRGRVLHWGGAEGDKGSRNDVRAFDAAAGDWVSDYPSDPPSGATGQSYGGVGSMMMKSGRPRPYYVLQGSCWDSKREQVVYTMKGLMAAYDPKAKTWKDLGAKTAMPYPVHYYDGDQQQITIKNEFPGGPPVYGVGTCYDPENDELLLFPHFDAKNIALREATGQITGHYGTFRYSFKDNTWALVSETFGSDEVKKARKELIAVMAKASAAMDAAWVLNRKPDAAKAGEAAKHLEGAAAEAEKLALPAEAKAGFAAVAGLLKSAAAALSGGKPGEAMKPARDALAAMNDVLDGALRVEPPARCAAPMVYDPKNKAIVMFGGQTNISRTDLGGDILGQTGLDDTWLYDAKTKQWREVAKTNRPPRTRIPLLAYDPESGLVLLVTISGDVWNAKVPRKAALWTLDAAKDEWSRRDEQDWPGALVTRSGQGSEGPKSQMPASMLGFDAKARLLLVVQPEQGGQATYALKLDLGKLSAQPAPAWTPPPPIKPYEWTADDPAWVARLKSLPVNTWVPAKPPREPARRDWGIAAVDPVRGWVVYFGGGHSSYQCNDVAVYPVGANRWSTGVGEHNAFVPPNEWEGSTLGHRGGPATGHQRNTYQAFDGRMYLFYGTNDKLPGNYVFHAEPDFARFYDLDRGGVWRDLRIAGLERPEKVPPALCVQFADPKGRLFNLIGEVPHYYAANVTRYFASCLDLNENRLVVKEVPKPIPEQRGLGEGRPYCYLPDRDQVLLMNAKPEDPARNYSEDQKKFPLRQVTFLYDVKENKFTELPAKKTPPVQAIQVVEYAESQKCALAVIGNQQWVYSFEKGDWTQLPMKTEGGNMGFQGPYGQMVWVARYGVFVNLCGNTWVMRPEFDKIDWGK